MICNEIKIFCNAMTTSMKNQQIDKWSKIIDKSEL